MGAKQGKPRKEPSASHTSLPPRKDGDSGFSGKKSASVSDISQLRANAPINVDSTGSLRASNASRRRQGGPTEASESQYEAQFDYTANAGTDELSFIKGDIFEIHSKQEVDWWDATNLTTGQRGMIPSNYVAPGKSVESNQWFHGKMSRSTAEYLLNSGINGSFLIRESESNPGEYSVSVKYDGKMFHYRIQKDNAGNLYVSAEHVFPSLVDLVKHHSKSVDGLVAPLKHPILKQNKPTVFGLAHGASDKWEIPKSEINLGRKLGAGQYGDVYEGRWKGTVHVAVKTLKDTMEVKDFLQEAAIMKKLRHENLVQLLGVCTQESPLYIVTEFMAKGNLLEFLRSEAGQQLDATELMYMASQVASGMAYLESQNFIHRDLAARNCLVGENNQVKVADFGLSRIIEDEYTAREGAKFPIKWTAPESLQYNKFTTKSDVWAFGILLWELATYGETPYPGVELAQVLDKIETGYRMPKPKGCPDEVYVLMKKCWSWEDKDRPTFKEIRAQLEGMFPSGNITEAVATTLQSEDHYAAPVKSSNSSASTSTSNGSAKGPPPPPKPNTPKPARLVQAVQQQTQNQYPSPAASPPTPTSPPAVPLTKPKPPVVPRNK